MCEGRGAIALSGEASSTTTVPLGNTLAKTHAARDSAVQLLQPWTAIIRMVQPSQ